MDTSRPLPSLKQLEREELRLASARRVELERAQATTIFLNVKDYGARGDGRSHPLSESYTTLAAARSVFPDVTALSDETDWAAIQKTIGLASAAGGGAVYVPEGEYRCSAHLMVAGSNVQLLGVPGASHLRWSRFTTFSRSAGFFRSVDAGIVADVDGLSVRGLKLTGPRAPNTYHARDALISMAGDSSRNRRQRLTILDCELSLSGAYAIQAQWVSRVVVERCFIHDCGYVGIELMSCDNGHVQHNAVRTIQPGTNGNMYGIVLDHDSSAYDRVDPGTKNSPNLFCERCVVFDNEVEDIDWEGIDMHGGYENHVIHNRVYDTRMGISCGSGSGAASRYAGFGNVVAFNLIDGRTSSALPGATSRTGRRTNNHYGINANGGALVRNDNVKIICNTLIQKGRPGDASIGAIQLSYCTNAQVFGNTLQQWGGVGIKFDDGTENIDVSDNQFLELVDPADNVATCIRATGTTSPAVLIVSRNRMSANGGTAGRVGFSGVGLRFPPRLSDNEFGAASVTRLMLPAPGFQVGTDGAVIIAADAGDRTPAIGAARGAPSVVLVVSPTRPYEITDIVDTAGPRPRPAAEGTRVEIINAGRAIVTLGRQNAVLAGGEPWVGSPNHTLVLRRVGARWYELSRSANA